MVRAYDPGKWKGIGIQLQCKRPKQTNSLWNFEGKAISGQMKGKQLTRLSYDEGFWFEWVAFHPKTELYKDSTDIKSVG